MMRGRRSRSTLGGALLGAVMAGCGIAKLWTPTQDDVIQRILPATVQVVVAIREQQRPGRSSPLTLW